MTHTQHLNEVAIECMTQLSQLNIPYGNVRGFAVNKRALKRWGRCSKRPEGYYIQINDILCDGKHDDGLRETLMHELIHTCPGCMNHKAPWKVHVSKVNAALGMNIKRCNSAEDKGVEEVEVIERKKYNYICEGCGYKIGYARQCKFTRHPELYICGRCGGKFHRC